MFCIFVSELCASPSRSSRRTASSSLSPLSWAGPSSLCDTLVSSSAVVRKLEVVHRVAESEVQGPKAPASAVRPDTDVRVARGKAQDQEGPSP